MTHGTSLSHRLRAVLLSTRDGNVARVVNGRTHRTSYRAPRGIGSKSIIEARTAGLIEDGAHTGAISTRWQQRLTAAGEQALMPRCGEKEGLK